MFSKAKRFESIEADKKNRIKRDIKELQKCAKKVTENVKPKGNTILISNETAKDTNSQCSSKTSVRSFVTPKPCKLKTIRAGTSSSTNLKSITKLKGSSEILKAQEAEIRNKDYTITEYVVHIEELKNEISNLKSKLSSVENLENNLSKLTLDDKQERKETASLKETIMEKDSVIQSLNMRINDLQGQCQSLEIELNHKQIDYKHLEELIIIRDSLCQDLQEKLNYVEKCLIETYERLEMVKGHHSLALEANESIRKEYKLELDTLKTKFEDEKSVIINKSKIEQDNIKTNYELMAETIRNELTEEKNKAVEELQQQIKLKEFEMNAKLEQINEATYEKIKLCEIQFEERSKSLQEHWTQKEEEIRYLEDLIGNLKHSLSSLQEKHNITVKEYTSAKGENDLLKLEKHKLIIETEELKEKNLELSQEVTKLKAELDKTIKEKFKYETSLSVTRDIVQVLTLRLRESDAEIENLETKIQSLTNLNETFENDIATIKSSLNSTVMECQEYKEALVNILKSKAALAKEHTRIMEHNVSLIESLQNVEKEAYRELGSIKTELIEDVELLKKESDTQIQLLREEVKKKNVLCELASEHAGNAAAAAEQSRLLLAQASAEITRLESENHLIQKQIQDQQSLVVELSLLRQENEELALTVAKQSSIIEQMKKDMENIQIIPKASPIKKSLKIGKENIHIISPLRERNY